MKRKICPVWVGYLLANPLRRFMHNPNEILRPYVKEGMKVMDFGCAMGFFSLPMAELTGTEGKVLCVDIQKGMLSKLEKRAKKKNLLKNIELINIEQRPNIFEEIKESVDFALAFAVVHETPCQTEFFKNMHISLKEKSQLLISEPGGHVSKDKFEKTVKIALENGFKFIENPRINKSMSVLLEKI